MNVIVVGCGRTGAELAYSLAQKGHQVAVIDLVASSFANLRPEFRGRTVEGEALNRDVLIRAGIETAHGLAAVTNSDSANAVLGRLARAVYQVPNIVVRNYDSRWRLLHEVFGLQIINSTDWGVQRIEELLYHREVHVVFSAGNGEVGVYEFVVPASWQGRNMSDLMAKCQCIPVAITRAGRAMLPDIKVRLEEGDILNISATLEGIWEIRRKLEGA